MHKETNIYIHKETKIYILADLYTYKRDLECVAGAANGGCRGVTVRFHRAVPGQ